MLLINSFLTLFVRFDSKSRTQVKENIEKLQTILEVYPLEVKSLSKGIYLMQKSILQVVFSFELK